MSGPGIPGFALKGGPEPKAQDLLFQGPKFGLILEVGRLNMFTNLFTCKTHSVSHMNTYILTNSLVNTQTHDFTFSFNTLTHVDTLTYFHT